MTETTPETETMIETTDEATIETETTDTTEATEPVGDERVAKLSAEAKQHRLRAKEAEAERDKTQALLTTLRARMLAEHVVKAGRVREDAATAVAEEISHDPAIFTETGDLDTETVGQLLGALRQSKAYYFSNRPSGSRREQGYPPNGKPKGSPLEAAVNKALNHSPK